MKDLLLDMVIYENLKKVETESNSKLEQLQLEIPEYDYYVVENSNKKEEEPKRVIEIEL
jgi:hypothetical protein